jgi:hypothetical protein
MTRGRRLAMTTEEENFQVWLEKNWDRPLSEEVERLQDALKRLETMHAADTRRLQRAESEWWGLLRKLFLVCLGLVALVLWYNEQLLGNERHAQRGVRVNRARGERKDQRR